MPIFAGDDSYEAVALDIALGARLDGKMAEVFAGLDQRELVEGYAIGAGACVILILLEIICVNWAWF